MSLFSLLGMMNPQGGLLGQQPQEQMGYKGVGPPGPVGQMPRDPGMSVPQGGGGIMDRIGGLFNDPRSALLLTIGSSLLESGGPSPTPISTGQALGRALQAGMGEVRQRYQDDWQRKQQEQALELQDLQMKVAIARLNEGGDTVNFQGPDGQVFSTQKGSVAYQQAVLNGYPVAGSVDAANQMKPVNFQGPGGKIFSAMPGTPQYAAAMQAGYPLAGTVGNSRTINGVPMNVKEFEFYKGLPKDQQEEYLTVKRANQIHDVGGVPTAITPSLAQVPFSDLQTETNAAAEKAAATAKGTAKGGAEFALPQVEQDSAQAIATLEQLKKHPGLSGSVGVRAPFATKVPGSEEANFVALNDQASGQVFLNAFQKLKGGGSITEKEGEKAEQAVARIRDRNQSEKAYVEAVDELIGIVKTGVGRARKQAGGKASAQAAPEIAEGTIQTNTRTRERRIWQGGKWEPMQ